MPEWMSLLAWGDSGWGDEMVRGAMWTILLATVAFALGVVIGAFGAAAKLSPLPPLRWLGEGYTTVIRGVPDLLVIYLLFFGGNQAVMSIARSVFGYDGYIELNAFTIGAVALSLVSGAYATEVIRGAVLTVPTGQLEAARACGMSGWLLFRRILVPQVARYALPGLGNVWQLTLKDTSLISIVGLVEIMRSASIASGSTQKPFVFYLAAACLYLLLTSGSNRVFGLAELWANRGVRRA
jgi:octopine/nopaline transport system permease protein